MTLSTRLHTPNSQKDEKTHHHKERQPKPISYTKSSSYRCVRSNSREDHLVLSTLSQGLRAAALCLDLNQNLAGSKLKLGRDHYVFIKHRGFGGFSLADYPLGFLDCQDEHCGQQNSITLGLISGALAHYWLVSSDRVEDLRGRRDGLPEYASLSTHWHVRRSPLCMPNNGSAFANTGP